MPTLPTDQPHTTRAQPPAPAVYTVGEKRRQNPMQREPGPLRNGNPRGNPNTAPRCGARTRVDQPCGSPAMANGRCRMHGGRSTGPTTPEGLARITAARTTHGFYSAEGRAFHIGCRTLVARAKLLTLLARDPNFGNDPADLQAFAQPLIPQQQRRKRTAKFVSSSAPPSPTRADINDAN